MICPREIAAWRYIHRMRAATQSTLRLACDPPILPAAHNLHRRAAVPASSFQNAAPLTAAVHPVDAPPQGDCPAELVRLCSRRTAAGEAALGSHRGCLWRWEGTLCVRLDAAASVDHPSLQPDVRRTLRGEV